jgi:hypothetical protein
MGESKRRKKSDPDYGKTLRITKEPSTHEMTYVADLLNAIELFYYNPETNTVHSSFSPLAHQFGKMMDFKHSLLLDKFESQKGYYFVNHLTKTANYAGDNFKQALETMKERGYVKNIVSLIEIDNDQEDDCHSQCDDDDDGNDLEFDEDGECVGDDTWDYPGSPYLSDDDDIY